MGLDFPQLDLSCSYGSFAYFREMLAKEMGWNNYGLFCPGYVWTQDKDKLDEFRNDPMFVFMMHSDCEGEISAKDCGAIAPRMRELIKNWHDDAKDEYTREGGWKIFANTLADGMEELARKNKALIFD
jgi:hypothetical protein